jgi:glycyl-tRNA synthetase beta chain
MYWRRRGELFVRPVRWLVAMLDDQVVPMEVFGVPAGKVSRGHRLLGSEIAAIARPSAYVEALRAAKVLGATEREQAIRKALDTATRTITGARWREDKPLLATVVNLTEFPSVTLGSFDPEFLALPEEVLVTVMRDHQKYFALEDANGKLLPHFLAVLNTTGDADGLIRHGNERVLRARFNDARFFWQTDQKQTLRQRVELLKSVTFQKDLGSYYEKTLRVQHLSSWLAETVKQSGMAVRPGVVHKAALLAKTDLTTELVKEFTELQGIVGGLYAAVQPLDEDLKRDVQVEVSKAIYDHYKPESMEDDVPRTLEGAVLSIADKADSIAGMFALGLIPSGSKDPFALRRQANGIVKTIAEHKLPLRLSEILASALDKYRDSAIAGRSVLPLDYKTAHRGLSFYLGELWSNEFLPDAVKPENERIGELAAFLRERLTFYLREKGFSYDVVAAALGGGKDDVADARDRASAIAETVGLPDFGSIATSFKRMKNILRQALEKFQGKSWTRIVDEQLLVEQEEKNLASQMRILGPRVNSLRGQREYSQALREIAKIRPFLDSFFDKVMVMTDDARIRANRLALIENLLAEFSTIADFSEIVTEGKESTK